VEAVKNRYIAADIERTKQVIYAAWRPGLPSQQAR